MNVCNVFIMYTLGVFFYSRGNSNMKESIKNILKLPAIWFAILALVCNLSHIHIHPALLKSLEMGAYCAMILQLLVFGMFLCSVKVQHINKRLSLVMSFIKFIFSPLIIAFIIFKLLNLEPLVAAILFVELVVPLGVSNVNLSMLYNCKPLDVTYLVFMTSIIFIPFFIIVAYWLHLFSLIAHHLS